MAISCMYNLDIHVIDIATFFLYGVLFDPLYMNIPAGWAEDGIDPTLYCWRLKKGLYRCPQAGHCAQQELTAALAKGDQFVKSSADDCLHVSNDDSTGYAACGHFVDDLLCIGDKKGLAKLTPTMTNKFGRDQPQDVPRSANRTKSQG